MVKFEMGNGPQSVPTELSSLMHNVGALLKSKLQPGVVMNPVLGATEYTIMSDPKLLTQILVNLLSNACKFTTKGAITYGYEIFDDEIYFSIKDTGIGISDEQKMKLSQLFYMGTEIPGGGMGLSVSKAIVDSLGGEIGMESRGVGKGSTFWFTIPNSSTQSDAPQEEEQEESAGDFEHTILIAEDNDSNFLLFESILDGRFNLVRARNGLEAVDLCKKYNPNLILMDIQMPQLDGHGAVREIRKFNVNVPIIAVTAYAFVSDRQLIMESGFNDYMSKPISVARLEQKISTYLK